MSRKFSSVSRLAVLTAVVAVAATVGTASATVFTGPTSLDQLLIGTGNSMQVGGLSFSDFDVLDSTGTMPGPSAVTVTPVTIVVANGQTTYGICLGGTFYDAPPTADDFGLSYQVASIISGAAIIAGAHLDGDPDVTGAGFATVTETYPQIGNAKIKIFDIPPGSPSEVADITFSQNYSSLLVEKDIMLDAGNSQSLAQLSLVDQTYYIVPEPASLGFLGLGLIGLVARRRR